jgi:hypothetical protein
MKLMSLEIPDDPAELPGWLESHLVGLDQGALIAELEAVHGTRPATPGLEGVLGPQLEAVLDEGLAVLPASTLRRLLDQPRLLLELQERIVTTGGDYWFRLPQSNRELTERLERGRRALKEIVGADPDVAPGRSAGRPAPRRAARQYRPWFVSLATAAIVLALVAGYERLVAPSGGSPVWGWSAPGALAQDAPRDVYLNRLADAGEEWFRQRPAEPVSLARRIGELRHGCSVLILAAHAPLSAPDRAWLRAKCRVWAAKLDRHLADVEGGAEPLQIRAEVDETVRALVGTLRERARSSA